MRDERDTLLSTQTPDEADPLLETAPATLVATPSEARPRRKSAAKTSKTRAKAAPAKAKAPAKKAASRAKGERAPRSRRAPAETTLRSRSDEASIPPTWSDLDEQGDRVATDAPLEPAGTPTLVAAAEGDELPITARTFGAGRAGHSWYAKAGAALLAAACVLAVGRAVVLRGRHAPPPSVSAAAAPPAAAVVDTTGDTITAPTDTLNPGESATEARQAALTALEHAKLADAVAAGERSVALDPTDGDAWLILGAAYQDQGNIAAARRSYLACTKQATHGEIRECTFLLQ